VGGGLKGEGEEAESEDEEVVVDEDDRSDKHDHVER
jgi:hypothetical protein